MQYDLLEIFGENKKNYCSTRVNKGLSWIAAAAKKTPKIGAFYRIFVYSHEVKINKF